METAGGDPGAGEVIECGHPGEAGEMGGHRNRPGMRRDAGRDLFDRIVSHCDEDQVGDGKGIVPTQRGTVRGFAGSREHADDVVAASGRG
jgi:hypothetical protein